MALSLTQSKILEQLGAKRSGLSTKEANNARKLANDDMNLVDPPVNCPKWVCCLLPCIKNIPSMKIFKQILPEDAEIKRNNKWVCYDAASVVRGDIIRLREGDTVPADCIVLSLGMEVLQEGELHEEEEMSVDVSRITGETRPRTMKSDDAYQPIQLFYGGYVLHGCCVAVVNATGKDTILASLMRDGRWPPSEDLSIPLHACCGESGDDMHRDEEMVVSLLSS